MLVHCRFCKDLHEQGEVCPVMAQAKMRRPIDRRESADEWLATKMGPDEATALISLFAEYYRMGGRRGLFEAGMRLLKYDKKADRERQRLRRAQLKQLKDR